MQRSLIALLVAISVIASACGSQASTATDVPSPIALVEETVSAPESSSTTSTAPASSTTTTAQTSAPTTSTAPTSSTTTTTTADTTAQTSSSTTTAPTAANDDSVAVASTPNENERTWVATAKDHVFSLTPSIEPNGALFTMPWLQPNPHQFGTPLTLMVTEGEAGDDWVKVQLPIRPNGQEAWVSTADYDISAVYHRAEVNLTTQRVTVWENGEIVAQTDAVVGASNSPTPFGDFYVVASVQDYFGEPALALSSFSEAFDTFDGGLPVIAIHRTFGGGNQESDHSVGSNGCVRVPVETIRFLARTVPLGTPVSVVS